VVCPFADDIRPTSLSDGCPQLGRSRAPSRRRWLGISPTDIRPRHHRCGAWTPIGKDRELAEAITGPKAVDRQAGASDVGLTLLEHHELVAAVSLAHDHLSGDSRELVRQVNQLASRSDRQVVEDVDLSETLGAISSKSLALHRRAV
jgi:hypothetical protein